MSQAAVGSFKQKCEKFFKDADQSGDGVLSIQELCKIIRMVFVPKPGQELTDQDICKMFVDLDSDSDNKLTLEEFNAVLGKSAKDVTTSELREAFKELDTDNSGSLSPDEVRTACAVKNVEISDEQVAQADTNNDGKLDYEEFLDAWNAGN